MKYIGTLIAILILGYFDLIGQHLYQLPKPLVEKSQLEEIIGTVNSKKPSRPLHLLWVYGYDGDHIAGAHDYVKVKDLMKELLGEVPDLTFEEVFHFPTEAQFSRADLAVMYLHLPRLKKRQYATFQAFIERGGGVVSLHETAIMRPASKGKLLSECLGFAWNEGVSKWGAIFEEVNINNDHPIFRGFPNTITIRDEFYWDLYQEQGTKVLGSVRTGPDGEEVEVPIAEEQLSEEESPMFWTYELGKGKVFGTTTGHHTFTYYDPEFRIILFRAMAWVVNEQPDPFMPLVFEGITNEKGQVGITEDLRYWEGKRRK
ncbi:MAG: ThuA domain-containing protein [Bacteroidetes bacterium]|nr:ThuA domain-containing protein [Bacteroidota bacterium]